MGGWSDSGGCRWRHPLKPPNLSIGQLQITQNAYGYKVTYYTPTKLRNSGLKIKIFNTFRKDDNEGY